MRRREGDAVVVRRQVVAAQAVDDEDEDVRRARPRARLAEIGEAHRHRRHRHRSGDVGVRLQEVEEAQRPSLAAAAAAASTIGQRCSQSRSVRNDGSPTTQASAARVAASSVTGPPGSRPALVRYSATTTGTGGEGQHRVQADVRRRPLHAPSPGPAATSATTPSLATAKFQSIAPTSIAPGPPRRRAPRSSPGGPSASGAQRPARAAGRSATSTTPSRSRARPKRRPRAPARTAIDAAEDDDRRVAPPSRSTDRAGSDHERDRGPDQRGQHDEGDHRFPLRRLGGEVGHRRARSPARRTPRQRAPGAR